MLIPLKIVESFGGYYISTYVHVYTCEHTNHNFYKALEVAFSPTHSTLLTLTRYTDGVLLSNGPCTTHSGNPRIMNQEHGNPSVKG